jgi:hypothetical protein
MPRLNQVLAFTDVAPGATVALPHDINVAGLPIIPDFVFRDNANFEVISCTTTMLTVRNTGAGVETLNAWLELQHSIDREYGATVVTHLVPQPFIPAVGIASVPPTSSPMALPEQWIKEDVDAGLTNDPMDQQVSANFIQIEAIRAGSIIGLNVRFVNEITVGSATIKATINGVPAALTATLNVGDTSEQVTQPAGVDTYVAGDLIGLCLSTSIEVFSPAENTVEGWLEVQE